MWVGLVFVACLSAQTDDRVHPIANEATTECRSFEVKFDGSMMQCLMFGQQRIANWQDQNEPWALKGGYHCKMGSPA